MTTIGFIGLGVMGRPMALNLLEAGFPLVVHSRSPEPVAALREAGATPASSPAEVAASADVVITMLPDSAAVRSVVAGDRGVLSGARRGSLLVDMSTIHPAVATELAAAAREHGLGALDAPVSGGDVGARQATLSIMVGGGEEDVLPSHFFDELGCGPCAGEQVRAVLEGVDRLDQHLDAAPRCLVGGPTDVLTSQLELGCPADSRELEPDQGVQPATAEACRQVERNRHVGAELVLAGRVAQEAPVAGAHVAGVEVEQRNLEPCLLDGADQRVEVLVPGPPELHSSETGLSRRSEAVEEGDLGEEHREVGGEAKGHTSLRESEPL